LNSKQLHPLPIDNYNKQRHAFQINQAAALPTQAIRLLRSVPP
jgi:hypothetical protein